MVHHAVGGSGEIIDIGDRSLRFVLDLPVVFERQATDAVPGFPLHDPLHQFQKSEFALAAYDGVNKGLAQRLIHCQGRMPAAEYDRHFRAKRFDRASNPDRTADHRASQNGDSQTERTFRFAQDGSLKVGSEIAVRESNLKSSLYEGSRQAK